MRFIKRPKQILCGIDIGSTKVSAVIGRLREDSNDIEFLGLGCCVLSSHPDEFDIDIYSSAIEEAVTSAHDMAGERAPRIWVNVSSGNIKSIIQKSSITISDTADEVRQRDIARLIKDAKEIALSLDREILHTIPLGWALDGQDGIIRNPLGLYGTRLGMELHIISALSGYLRNLRKCIRLSGLEVEGMVYSGIATGLSVLTEQERQDGVLLIDIGGKKTDICLFVRGLARSIEQFDFGGEHLTCVISKALKVPHQRAERQKLSYVASRDASLRKVLTLEQTKILKFIYSRIIENHWDKQALSGVVITGRSAFLDGMLETACDIFGMPVRMGLVPLHYFSALSYSSESPVSYATSIGLLKYAVTHSDSFGRVGFLKGPKEQGFFKRLLHYGKEIWQEYF